MPGKPSEVTINGTRYEIQQLGGKTAGLVMHRLAGQGISIVAALGDGSFSPAVMPSAEWVWLRDTLIPTTKVGVVDTGVADAPGDGRTRFLDLSMLFDEHFAGPKAPEQFLWVKAVLEVSFGPLDVAFGALFRRLQTLLGSKPPKAAPGSAGASSSAPA